MNEYNGLTGFDSQWIKIANGCLIMLLIDMPFISKRTITKLGIVS